MRKTDYISLLRDSVMSSTLNFCFLFIYFFCSLEEKEIEEMLEEIQIVKKRNFCMWNQYYYFDLSKIGSVGACSNKLSCLCHSNRNKVSFE